MPSETVRPLDSEALELFAAKGTDGGRMGDPQSGIGNGVKVRRVIQSVRDLATRPFDELRVLDLACGEGVYAIESALRGAEVLAIDGRNERMDKGAEIAKRLGLTNLQFELKDIRQVTATSHGTFDVVYFLGILYHLDVPDVFQVLENVYEMCKELLIIDTHVSPNPETETHYKGRAYKGAKYREHGDKDTDSVRRSRVMSSLDNTFSFFFTKDSLVRLLNDVGFTSVLECNVPTEPFKPKDRISLVAAKGTPVKISTYPWVNDKGEEEIERVLASAVATTRAGLWRTSESSESMGAGVKIKLLIRSAVNRILRPLGFEIRRI